MYDEKNRNNWLKMELKGAGRFVDSYGGWNKFERLVRDNSVGTINRFYGCTEQEKTISEKAFLDYVKKGMNAERYAEMDSERGEWLAEIDAMAGIREDWQ